MLALRRMEDINAITDDEIVQSLIALHAHRCSIELFSD